jgi:hypothetical protein
MGSREATIISCLVTYKRNITKKTTYVSFWADRTIAITREYNKVFPSNYIKINFNVT